MVGTTPTDSQPVVKDLIRSSNKSFLADRHPTFRPIQNPKEYLNETRKKTTLRYYTGGRQKVKGIALLSMFCPSGRIKTL